jgi:hypothetical protein
MRGGLRGQLLDRIHPHAKVYIINVDGFFEQSETAPVKTILHDPTARDKYEAKRFWQRVHERAVPGTSLSSIVHAIPARTLRKGSGD